MGRRVLSLWLPRLAVNIRERASPDLRDRPFALIGGLRGRLMVTAVNGVAEQAGARPGRTLADARAIVPALLTAAADPAADARHLAQLSDWCNRYTPFATPDGGDGVMLDVSGCAHLLGGEDQLLDDVLGRLGRQGFAVRGALADTPAAAWGLARFHPDGRVIIASGAQRAALDPLPTAALRLSAAVVDGLDAVGLRRIGDLHRLPRESLTARFGRGVGDRLDQALGRREEPISPRLPVPPHAARLSFAEPLSRAEDLAEALRRLLAMLCAGLEKTGEGARRLALSAWRVDGVVDASPQEIAIGTGRPLRDPAVLLRLFAPKLDQLAPGPGFETIGLAAPVTAAFHPEQAGFAERETVMALGELTDNLNNRLGERAALRLVPRQSWRPERAVAGVAPLDENAAANDCWPADRPRPVRLLTPPEPIDAMAPMPDDPPVMFRWRGRVHRLRRAEGPERIAAEWWRRQGPPRDYYRVEDGDGRRFWLFREGLYQPGSSPRWFLHGVFG